MAKRDKVKIHRVVVAVRIDGWQIGCEVHKTDDKEHAEYLADIFMRTIKATSDALMQHFKAEETVPDEADLLATPEMRQRQ